MSIKVGLGQRRKKILEKELERVIPLVISLGVEKIILFGSLVGERTHRSSDLDILVVKKTNKRFIDRLDEFYQYLSPSCAMDILVYTPEELECLEKESSFIKRVLRKGRILYEAK
jgi:predicted nucleotidyltransferase